MKSSKPSVCFTLMSHSDTGFSSEILDVYLDSISFAIENTDSHSQVVPNILRSFPIIETSISLKMFLIKI